MRTLLLLLASRRTTANVERGSGKELGGEGRKAGEIGKEGDWRKGRFAVLT